MTWSTPTRVGQSAVVPVAQWLPLSEFSWNVFFFFFFFFPSVKYWLPPPRGKLNFYHELTSVFQLGNLDHGGTNSYFSAMAARCWCKLSESQISAPWRIGNNFSICLLNNFNFCEKQVKSFSASPSTNFKRPTFSGPLPPKRNGYI